MEAVSDMNRFWRTFSNRICENSRPVSANNLRAGMLFEPFPTKRSFARLNCRLFAVRQEVNGGSGRQVNENSAVSLSFAEGKIVAVMPA